MQKLFLPVVIIFIIVALIYPPSFVWGKPYIPYFLGLVMFGMGASLETKEFVDVFKNWKAILLGVISNYTVMPLIALTLGVIFHLDKDLFLGLVLVGCCPSGTASNVMTYIGKGNVALSVTMTLISTFIAPLATPAIFYLIAEQMIDISFTKMAMSVFWIVVFPLADGLIVRHFFRKYVEKFIPFLPGFSLFIIALLIAIIIGLNKDTILKFQLLIIITVIIHNIAGFGVGYYIGKLFSLKDEDKRAMAFEIGMQNSGLSTSLAISFLSHQSALPSALFSLWQNISGSFLAKHWSKKRELNYNNNTVEL